MRVIAGLLKGRRLRTPTWEGLRPTSDRLRETLFNVLAPRIGRARVLDGYAGTGAVGIEAFSRGARHVTFVDRDRRALALIAANVEHCAIPSGCVIIRPGFEYAAHPAHSDESREPIGLFDIVVLDPPYSDHPDQVILSVAHLVAPGGVLVLEHSKRRAAPDIVATLTRTRQIRTGDTVLSFYEPPAAPQ
jgi:16S rRNA (guanine(966)-N(2))-methyltransferase RsmD